MPQSETGTRRLHEFAAVERMESFQQVVDEHLGSGCLVVAPPDERVRPFLPADHGQQALPGAAEQLKYPSDTTCVVGGVPTTSDESFDLETDGFEHGVLLMPPTGGYHRAKPFLDVTRVVEPGGSIITITGLRADREAGVDAKWWVPASKQAHVDRIYAVERGEADMATPALAAVFNVERPARVAPNQQELQEVAHA